MLGKPWALIIVFVLLSTVVVVSGDTSDPIIHTQPVADIGADQTIIESQSVTIDVGNSTDPDGNITRYEIDFGDGTDYDFVSNLIPISTILIYSTADETGAGYGKIAFDTDLVDILTGHGYTVNVTDRVETPTLQASTLNQYGQLWFISADYDTQGDLTSQEVDLILDFARSGRGLFIVSDHGSGVYESIHDANQISIPLGVRYYGLINQGPNGEPISPNFVPHEITSGLSQICGHDSAAAMEILSPDDVTVVASYNSWPMIAVRDDEAGRVVFENTLVRFLNVGHEMPKDWVRVADTPQYMRNVADFLAPDGYEKPPLIEHYYGDDGRGTDGFYTIRLRVTDDELETSEDDMIVTVLNSPPQITVSPEVIAFRNVPVALHAHARDNGSDDLVFLWDFGDGSVGEQSTYYNNGVGADPYPSPGPIYPFEVSDTKTHSFGRIRTYYTYLTVMDDDGGSSFAQIAVHVVPFLPPRDLTSRSAGSHIVLEWKPSPSIGVDKYVIFAGDSPISLDLNNPVGEVSSFNLEWVDLGVSAIEGEKYYTVRAYNETYALMSRTSNTAGKFTKRFEAGVSAFSIPLEPFYDTSVSDHLLNISNTEYIRWMETDGRWVTHQKGMQRGENDALVEMGRGYEILLSGVTLFTFCGLPGGMINYTEGFGGNPDFISSLSVELDGSNVVLSWDVLPGAVEYLIYRSSIRGGLFEESLSPIAVTATQTWADTGMLSTQGDLYYFVVPVDQFGELGSSTYSIGVQTVQYQDGTDSFSLPLNTSEHLTLDDLCDDIPHIAGLMYTVLGYWRLHAVEMPANVYDTDVRLGVGFQISIENPSPILWTFVGY